MQFAGVFQRCAENTAGDTPVSADGGAHLDAVPEETGDPRLYLFAMTAIVQLAVGPLERIKILQQTRGIVAILRSSPRASTPTPATPKGCPAAGDDAPPLQWGPESLEVMQPPPPVWPRFQTILRERGLWGIWAGTLTGIGKAFVGEALKRLFEVSSLTSRAAECCIATGLACYPFDGRHTYRAAEFPGSCFAHPGKLFFWDPEVMALSAVLNTVHSLIRVCLAEWLLALPLFGDSSSAAAPEAAAGRVEAAEGPLLSSLAAKVFEAVQRRAVPEQAGWVEVENDSVARMGVLAPLLLSVVVAHVLMHPVDTVYRLMLAQQALVEGVPRPFRNVFHCAAVTYRREGLSGFFCGISASTLKLLVGSGLVYLLV